MLKAFLQGKPFRHPLHPALVHFPIGLFLLALIMDALSFLDIGAGVLPRASFYAVTGGLLFGLLAAATGLADRSDIRIDHPARKTANIHMTLNLIALSLFAVNVGLRAGQAQGATVSFAELILSLSGVGILLVSGYLGGTMVYDDGVGVGRHRRYSRTPRKTIDVSIFERRDGLVPVCDEDQIQDGETLRIDWNGNILTLAKQAGKVYAFQEFCTHRYGPLSEGKLQGHQVECPWHRSCFDIRTGEVIEGPAKINLKTYPATIRDGKIFIG